MNSLGFPRAWREGGRDRGRRERGGKGERKLEGMGRGGGEGERKNRQLI